MNFNRLHVNREELLVSLSKKKNKEEEQILKVEDTEKPSAKVSRYRPGPLEKRKKLVINKNELMNIYKCQYINNNAEDIMNTWADPS